MMSNNAGSRFWDIRIDRNDLDGARSWMCGICGPHRLVTSNPELLQFRHSGNIFKSMATTLGTIEYGTDVTVDIDDAEHFCSYSLSLPLVGEQELSRGGTQLKSNCDQAIIVSPNENQALSISGSCRKLQVVITRVAMIKSLEELLQRTVNEPLRFEPVMDAVGGATASWWRMAQLFIEELERSSVLYEELAFTRELESSLIKGLILAQPNNYSNDLRDASKVKLPHYLIKAKQYIHDHARESLNLEDIEVACGVSRFTLFEAFRKYFSMAPMAYLRKHRLSCVRQEILVQGIVRSISEIALGWGFTHLGRFSAEYRKLYGETPSATLQRVRRANAY